MKGVILDKQSFDRGDLDLLALEKQGITWVTHLSTEPHQIQNRIQDADIVITNKVRIDAETVSRSTSLKLVMLAATGTDNVDLEECKKRNIVVCNTREYATPAVAQHVFTLILNLMTHLTDYQRLVNNDQWQKSNVFCLLDYPITELAGKTLGVVGFGVLGKKVAQIAEAFDMNVVALQRQDAQGASTETIERLPLDGLLAQSDVISLHCPLTPQTHHLIGRSEFVKMKPNAVLINTARGAIVDSDALIEALKSNQIAGAGIDVLDKEPPTDAHPLIANKLHNLIVTPHNAWGSAESRQRLVNQLGETLDAWLAGSPQNVVNS